MKNEQPKKEICWISWQWNGVAWFMSNTDLSFCKQISESDFSTHALWRCSSWWDVRLYLLLMKCDGTGSLFLCTARWSAWWAISHHNRGTGAFLPLGLPWLVAVEGGKEGWLQGCRALGVPAAKGDSEPWENGDARDPCWGWKGVLQVQDQSGEIKRCFDPFAGLCTARGTAHHAVAGGVAAPLGVLPSHPHMCGWHSLGQVAVRLRG